MRTRRPRGGTLPITIGVIAVLAVLLLALQFQGSAARQALLMSEARFQADVAAQNGMVMLQQGLSGDAVAGAAALSPRQSGDDQTVDFSVGLEPFANLDRNNLYVDVGTRVRPATGFGGKVYAKPDLSLASGQGSVSKVSLLGRSVQAPPFTARASFRAGSRDRNLAAVAPRNFEGVLQAGFPYGAYAPNGSITLTSAGSWTNPTWKDVKEDDPLTKLSGVPVRLAARSSITVTEAMPYGEARVSNTSGTVKVPGGAVGYVGRPLGPGTAFEGRLRDRLDLAFSTLQGRAYDKTGLLFGRPLSRPMDWFDLVGEGRMLDNLFTYEQATNFWFMMLPQINSKGTVIDVKLHLPLQPDQAPANPGAGQLVNGATTAGNEITKVDEEIEKVRAESTALEKVIQAILKAKADLETQKTAKVASKTALENELAPMKSEKAVLEAQLASQNKQDPKPTAAIASTQASLDAVNARISAKEAQIKAVTAEIDALTTQIAEKQKELDSHKKQAEDLNKREKDLETKRDGLTKQIKDNAGTLVEGYLGFDSSDLGPNRAREKKLDDSDKLYKANKGQTGFSYWRLIKKLVGAFFGAIKAIFEDFPTIKVKIDLYFFSFTIILPDFAALPDWLASLPNKFLKAMLGMVEDIITETVTLVHLGHEGPAFRLNSSTTFLTDKAFTVPAGRTFRLQKNLQVNQNIWVQKGACLVVDGNLDVLGDPKELAPVVGSLLRTGILFVEEGATVVVGGHLNANQVTVTGPGGKVRGITSAILCRGDVKIHNGTKPGITFADLFEYIFESKETGDALELFIYRIAPNLAKLPVLGPFHARKPYFSTYPTAFRIIIVPPLPPIVYPTFEPIGQNINNAIFRTLSYFFAVHLNLTLGENFMTCSDFWKIGENRVAILPKALSGAAVEGMRSAVQKIKSKFDALLNLSFDNVKNFVEDAVEEVAKVFLREHLPKLLVKVGTQMLLSFVPFGDIANSVFQPILDAIFEAILTGDGYASALGLTPAQDAVDPAFAEAEQVSTTKDRLFFAEVPGILIYSGGRMDLDSGRNLTIGGKTISSAGASMAAGLFVANGVCDLDVDYTIGAAISLTQDVRAKRLLYYAPFTSASIYLPKNMGRGGTNITSLDNFWEHSVKWQYGPDNDSGESFDIPEKPGYFPLVRSWQQ